MSIKYSVRTEDSDYGEDVYLDGDDGSTECIWTDSAGCDSPEDLIWSRDIEALFLAGVKMGKSL